MTAARHRRIAAVSAVGALTGAAGAQCEPEWLPAPPNSALSGPVWSLAVWDGDLVAAGAFTSAGGVPASHMGRWDGAAWNALGAGLGGLEPFVSDMVPLDGDLFVGGSFDTAGGQSLPHIARWDGSGWSGVGAGLPTPVIGLAVVQGDIVALLPLGWNMSEVRRWNGVSWSPLQENVFCFAEDITEYLGAPVVGGSINGFAGYTPTVERWDGALWNPMGTLPWTFGGGDTISVLLASNGGFFAGGRYAGPAVYEWAGTQWTPLEGGLPAWQGVVSLRSFRGGLIAGGWVPSLGQDGIRQWTGSTWMPLGDGVNGSVSSMVVWDGVLVAGGTFTTAGGLPSPYWARWGCACYADCNNSGGLSIADFGCFQSQFAAGHAYADCNNSGGLSIADFGCFQSRFAAGCP